MSTSFYSREELETLGLKSFGQNVLISRFARIYKPEMISIGNHVRIDDFCILSAGLDISIGDYVHISAYTALYGGGGIEIKDFAAVSVHSTIFSESDSLIGDAFIGPTVPHAFRNIFRKKTVLHKYSGLGPHSILLPGADLHEGAIVYANSFVTKAREAWTISIGSPAKRIRQRKKDILEIEKKLKETYYQINVYFDGQDY